MLEISWSDWLDFSLTEVEKVPSESGVYMMHAAMKILFIGGSDNLRQAVANALNDSCIKNAKRFKYSSVKNHQEVKIQLIKEYQEKHQGSLPACMSQHT